MIRKLKSVTLSKIKNRLWASIVIFTRKTPLYPLIYRSWWHMKLSLPQKGVNLSYISAIPNPGAGIGHQMANWIAGLWFAQQFSLPHAHIPFSYQSWEKLLGFGEQTVTIDELVHNQYYKKVTLPLFNEYDPKELALIRNIICSYKNQKIVFLFEQDQFYKDQFGVMEEIQRRFYNAPSRKQDKLDFDKTNFNIAIHIRRGDIVAGKELNHENMMMRWQNTDYFKNVLTNVIKNLKTNRPIKVYLFSQGSQEEFAEFSGLGNVEFCLDWDAQRSFMHMVFADLLITSKSSFSYKPGLLSRGIKVCSINFWHGYPDNQDWLLANQDGTLNAKSILRLNNQVN